MIMKKLTTRQRKFVEIYSGNGVQAARDAGYQGSDATLAQTAYELLRNPDIKSSIENRTKRELAPKIADREARQSFWTKIMESDDEDMKDRLKASELLGRSQADFTDKAEITGKDGEPIEVRVSKMSPEEREARIQELLAKRDE